ncbi:hypothetical protein ACHAXT_005341 [Thalassiosira profunda]
MRSALLVLSLSAALPAVSAAKRGGLAPLAIPRHKGARYPIRPSTCRWPAAFGKPVFTDKYIPSDVTGVVLKVPDFEAVFDDIQKVSPLAEQALTEDSPRGIQAIDAKEDVYKWKTTDSNPKRLVSHIDKIDDFQSKGVPIVRFRSTLHGPMKKRAEMFSELISDLELRKRWDVAVAQVETPYNAASFDEVEKLQEHKYGKVGLFGIGYVKTKQSVVSPREQLTLCAVQNFASGASIIWGAELEKDLDHLFPEGHRERTPRSTSHLWSTTFIPTGENTFDVEYVLQLEIGGFPGWLTGPIIVETVKKLFRFADRYFKSGLEEGGELAQRLALIDDEAEETSVEEENGEAEVNASVAVEEVTALETASAESADVTNEEVERMEQIMDEVTASEQYAPNRTRKRDRIKKLLRRTKQRS